jgi:hypothetical protein
MPPDSRRIVESYSFHISKTVDAPIKFVYTWCTDFRVDDGKLSKSKPRYKVIRVSPDRVVRIRISSQRVRAPAVALELVRLRPPNSWHVDQIDETDLAAANYKLTRLGPNRTRVTITGTERWMTRIHPDRSEYIEHVGSYWDTLVAALEARYRAGHSPKG